MRARERAEEGESERGEVGRNQGSVGTTRRSVEDGEKEQEVEAGGGRGSAVRAPRTMPDGMGKTTHEEVGWAGQPGQPGGLWWMPCRFQVSLSLSLWFLFSITVFYFSVTLWLF